MKTRFLFCFIALFIVLVGINAAQSTGDLLLGDDNQFWILPATECDGDNFCQIRISPSGTISGWDMVNHSLYISRLNSRTYEIQDLSAYSQYLALALDFVVFDELGYAMMFSFGGSGALSRYNLNDHSLQIVEFPEGDRLVKCNRYFPVKQLVLRFIYQVGIDRLIACTSSPQHGLIIHIINVNTLEIEQSLDIGGRLDDSNNPLWRIAGGLDNKIYAIITNPSVTNPEYVIPNLPEIDASQEILIIYDVPTQIWSYQVKPKDYLPIIIAALPNDGGIFFYNSYMSAYTPSVTQYDSDFNLLRYFGQVPGTFLGATPSGYLFFRGFEDYSDIQIMNINDYPLLTQYPENNLAYGN